MPEFPDSDLDGDVLLDRKTKLTRESSESRDPNPTYADRRAKDRARPRRDTATSDDQMGLLAVLRNRA